MSSCLSAVTPSADRASIMRSVSSLFRRFFRTVEPDDRAESRRALFDRLFDPGRFTVPKALDFLLRQILSIV